MPFASTAQPVRPFLPALRNSLIVMVSAFAIAAHAFPHLSSKPDVDGREPAPLTAELDTVESETADLLAEAISLVGVPYRWGGTSADSGFDCSGFVRAVYDKTIGPVLPRTAAQQAAATQKISRKDLMPGDLVFFNTLRRKFSHVGIYLGEGKFIHAPKPGAHVRIESMRGKYWSSRFTGARRVSEAQLAKGESAPERADASITQQV